MKNSSRVPGAAVPVLAALAVVGLAACGGSPHSTTGPDAVPVESSTPTVVLSQTLDDVEAGGERAIVFSLPRPGTLALTVRWTDENNSVAAVLTSVGCPNSRDALVDCQARRSSGHQGKDGREEIIDYPGASGAYRLVLQNQGPGAESIHVTGLLTTPSVAPPPPTPYPTERPERPTPRNSGKP